jgi:hypothetical protein
MSYLRRQDRQSLADKTSAMNAVTIEGRNLDKMRALLSVRFVIHAKLRDNRETSLKKELRGGPGKVDSNPIPNGSCSGGRIGPRGGICRWTSSPATAATLTGEIDCFQSQLIDSKGVPIATHLLWTAFCSQTTLKGAQIREGRSPRPGEWL